MKTNENKLSFGVGLYLMVFATIIILIWLVIAKFFDFEAKAIMPLIQNHPLMSWMYRIMDYRMVSNLIGITEIITAILLFIGLFKRILLKWAGILMTLTFFFTISFLFTTPGMFYLKEGFLVTDFFMLKDLVFLGLGVTLWIDIDRKG